MQRLTLFLLIAVCLSLTGAAYATEYHVGSGQQYATLNDLLLAVTLVDNDIAWVHPGTYTNFWVKAGGGSSQASAAQIRAYDSNNKPIFDANGANNCAQFEDPNSVYGMVGKWFLMDGLVVKNAATRGIYNVSCNIIVRNCYMQGNGNGYMGGWHNARDAERGDAIFEYNEFNGNGNGAYAHQLYCEGYNLESRYNYIHDATGGISHKDRSRNSIMEYNYISAGGPYAYRAFEFCGFDDNQVPSDTDQYATVTGNIITQNGGLNPWLFMSNERTEGGAGKNKGYMTMTNNSCYGENLTGPVIAGDKCAVTTLHNNIFHTNCTRMFDKVQGQRTYGTVNTSYNNWVTSGCTLEAAMVNTVVGSSPGWVNGVWPLGDFHLTSSSQCINAGNGSVGGLPTKEYDHPCGWVTRAVNGTIDIGAYEYGGGGGLPPVANFTGNPTSGVAPLAVAFTDTSTNSPTSWSWAFGDGSTSTAQNPSHTYAVGQYTVSLTATNAYGSDSEVKSNYITATSSGQPPVANFTGNPTSGTAPLNVMFTDTSSNTPTSWSWAFGDGSTSTAQNPSHSYAAGQYTVSLTATNAYGSDSEVKNNYITASSGGGGDFFCSSVVSEGGTIQSGDHTNLHASDDSYLVVLTAKLSGKYGTKLRYTFATGLSSLSSLSITLECHPSLQPQRQRIYAHNYSTGVDDLVDDRNLTSTSDTTVNVSVSNPSSYISGGEVQVYVRTGDTGGTSWTHYIDFLKITAAP